MNRKILKSKAAAIIGCGGLGCNISVHLAGEGVGKLFICDFDIVNSSNLNRQFFYSEHDIGKSKTESSYNFLKNYATDIEIFPVQKHITSIKDLSFAADCDLIFSAVDNNDTRKIISEYSYQMNIPLINGGVNGHYGNVYFYLPRKTPCIECAGLLSKNNKSINSISSAVGIVGALEADIGIKYLLGYGENSAGKLYIYDNSTITELTIKKKHDCPKCNNETE